MVWPKNKIKVFLITAQEVLLVLSQFGRQETAFWVGLVVKNLPASFRRLETWARSLGLEDPLEESI